MRDTLDRVRLIAGTGDPFIRIRLYNDDGDLVDLTTGYTSFRAKVAKRSNPNQAVLPISTGVTGDDEGFLIPAHAIAALPPTPVYILTAAANDGTGEPRGAQCEVVIAPSPL